MRIWRAFRIVHKTYFFRKLRQVKGPGANENQVVGTVRIFTFCVHSVISVSFLAFSLKSLLSQHLLHKTHFVAFCFVFPIYLWNVKTSSHAIQIYRTHCLNCKTSQNFILKKKTTHSNTPCKYLNIIRTSSLLPVQKFMLKSIK